MRSMNINRIKPTINKRYLLLIAGLMWFGVGLMLLRYSIIWLEEYGNGAFVFATFGFTSALLIHHFGFLKIVNKNLRRIANLNDKPCAFSFMSLKSYLLVMVMVSMGIALRHSSLPKQFLSVLYSGIGLALLLSSIRYLRLFLWQKA
jgi:hypothetical protein